MMGAATEKALPPAVGRFAPSPSGRLHLGNVLCALLAWASARSRGGRVLLRVEDLDTARCADNQRIEQLLNDLHWFGFDWDGGEDPADYQSRRGDIYASCFDRLEEQGLLYPCYCTRAALHAASAPHNSDRQAVYDGRCRIRRERGEEPPTGRVPAWRIRVPDETIAVQDGVQGLYSQQLARDCGDFILRRADGVVAYQLAVVADDALTGVTEVVRGRDLLSSTPRQLYLYRLLGFTPPRFYHIPLLLREDGTRLSKRDGALDIGVLRARFSSPEPLIGLLAFHAGLLPRPEPLPLYALPPLFDWKKVPREDIRLHSGGIL